MRGPRKDSYIDRRKLARQLALIGVGIAGTVEPYNREAGRERKGKSIVPSG
jgi:hypothetical protein